MKDKVFLDTSVFIYSVDSSPTHKEKSDIARQIIKQHIRGGTGVISIQVLQEFYQVSTRKIQSPLSTEDALEYLHYMAVLETVHPDFDTLVTAIYLHKRLKFSFWDALIVQAAAGANCSLLFTEDLQDGLHVGDLIIRNPFIADDQSLQDSPKDGSKGGAIP
ncbi:MAG: PIN domain-containing protein [Pseudomonadota bacterium]